MSPSTRRMGCPKMMVNGPCGGVRRGVCEVDGRPCPYVKADPRLLEIPRLGHGMIEKKLPEKPQKKPRVIEELESGRKLLLVELEPSRRGVGRRLVSQASHFKGIADGFTVTDNPLGRVQADPLAALALLRMSGFDEIVFLHISAKDRNRAALTSMAIGALWLGVDGFLALTGDWPGFMAGRARPVFDLDAVRLAYMLRVLRDYELDYMGGKIKEVPSFAVAVAFNPHATPFTHEIAKLKAKKRAGAEIIFTQPLFSTDDLRRVEEAHRILSREGEQVYVFPTFMVVRSPEEAWMLREKAGISVPRELEDSIREGGLDASIEYTITRLEEAMSAGWTAGAMLATHGDLYINRVLSERLKDGL